MSKHSRQWMLLGMAMAVAIGGLIAQPTTEARPLHARPDVLPQSWNLTFTHDAPRPIPVRIGDRTQWFWYMTYKVVNETDADQLFVPNIVMATNTGKITIANDDIPLDVFDAVKRRIDNPLLESPNSVIGRILRGPDYARESVAIWPATEPEVSTIRIFVGGISGETAEVRNPRTNETFLVTRTLMLTYDLPGKPDTIQFQPVVFEGRRWIMR
ncbi:MAG: hypothetical protein JJU36_12455 [Phycisphaeraceae bacterium]|nr:hypothetical protein [Phycisphaeraceae bacterium]